MTENYPQLKSNENFLALQTQLEGTENRITVARQRYIESVQSFNTTVRWFPTNLTAMMFKYRVKPNFTVENEAAVAKPPAVSLEAVPPLRRLARARVHTASGLICAAARRTGVAARRRRWKRGSRT